MTFNYCSINKEDISRILGDVSADENKYRCLQYLIEKNEFPTSWSLDAVRNEYLFKVPAIVRQSCDFFYFFSNGYMYQIAQAGTFGQEISFHRFPESSLSKRSKIESSVVDALIVCQDFNTWVEFNSNWENLTEEQRKMRVPKFIGDDCDCEI